MDTGDTSGKQRISVGNDAGEYGLDPIVMQGGKPLACAIRSLPSAECRNAQIENELLSMLFGLTKVHHYTYGRDHEVVTDHKPLVPIRVKPMGKALKCLQHILLKYQ